VFNERDFPRAYTAPGLAHKAASTIGAAWAIEQSETLNSHISIYVPGKQNLRSGHPAVDTLIARGAPVHTWRDCPGGGVVLALWPDEKHLLRAEESEPQALVVVTWSPRQVLGWAQAKGAAALGGPEPGISPLRPLDPVVAEAVDSLATLVGQHKTADRYYRGAIAKGVKILRAAGYELRPDDIHTYAIGNGWRASNAEILRDVVRRVNAGRVVQGIKNAPLRDDALEHWRAEAASQSDETGA
jgi:hypothetical protein